MVWFQNSGKKIFIRNNFEHRFFKFVTIKIKKLNEKIKAFSKICNMVEIPFSFVSSFSHSVTLKLTCQNFAYILATQSNRRILIFRGFTILVTQDLAKSAIFSSPKTLSFSSLRFSFRKSKIQAQSHRCRSNRLSITSRWRWPVIL